jgi:deoxyribonuclease V
MNYNEIIDLQRKLSKYITTEDTIMYKDIKHIAGIDIAYKGKKAYISLAILDKNTLKCIYNKCKESDIEMPYIRGLLFIREGNPMLNVLREDIGKYDIIMVDGNGILHPRRFGLASYIGFMLDKPTIGIAKSLLCGYISNDDVIDNNEIIGSIIRKNNRMIYVSIGNKISLKSAKRIVEECLIYSVPEPIRIAESFAKRYKIN